MLKRLQRKFVAIAILALILLFAVNEMVYRNKAKRESAKEIAFHIIYPAFFRWAASLSRVRFSVTVILLLPKPVRSWIARIES